LPSERTYGMSFTVCWGIWEVNSHNCYVSKSCFWQGK
jgi:hypothetical protein